MRRNTDRTAPLRPSPNHEALLVRRKHRLLQAHEKGGLAPQRRQGRRQHAAQEPEAPSPLEQGPERPCLAHLFSVTGAQAREHQPDSEGPAQRGAARLQRAGQKHRAEKGHREEPARPQPGRTKRKAVGAEKQGAANSTGQAHRPPGPRERNKGRRGPSMKTGGDHQDPQVSRGHIEKLLAIVEELGHLEKTGREGAQDGTGAGSPAPDLRHNGLDQGPEGKGRDPEQLWLVGSPCRRGSVSLASRCRPGDGGSWRRELEFAFEELFDMNRKLKKHLILNLAPRPRADPNPGREHSLSGVQDDSGETLRDRKTGGAEVEPGGEPVHPALVDAHQTASQDSLEKFLSGLENQKYPRLAKFTLKNEIKPFPKAGMLSGKENQLPSGTGSGQAPARLDPLAQGPRHPAPQDPADGAGWMAAAEPGPRPGREPEEQTGPPGLGWDAHPQAALDQQREQRRACLTHLKSPSSQDAPETDGACEGSAASLLPSIFVDHDRHSQMIRDLQQQIEEQTKLHKQFLEDARKRLQEFQRM
ncbi:metalloproteinase inhibitor 2 isoform X1 [Suricata suricatta]|nr:metalloproteinase inhibitor 2 isoform X1 [Suricata suricatta]XP_029783184.1 metalloproteinase inhibitor 2 isoform X1 [Suricata suricatta]XP_029783185.1 metalloproteinase inhibitor 2 isoform X1 [Suricata suricatta]